MEPRGRDRCSINSTSNYGTFLLLDPIVDCVSSLFLLVNQFPLQISDRCRETSFTRQSRIISDFMNGRPAYRRLVPYGRYLGEPDNGLLTTRPLHPVPRRNVPWMRRLLLDRKLYTGSVTNGVLNCKHPHENRDLVATLRCGRWVWESTLVRQRIYVCRRISSVWSTIGISTFLLRIRKTRKPKDHHLLYRRISKTRVFNVIRLPKYGGKVEISTSLILKLSHH